MLRCLVLSCTAVFMFLKVCNRPTPSPQPSTAVPSHYERRSNFDTVIVYVHGIFGDAKNTWTNDSTNAYWPQLLKEDDAFKNTDIYVYGYSSPYLSQTYSIDELIENMRLVLENDQVFSKHKSVVFLCHSMGGLITRGFLKRYQAQYASKVPLIYFFSTPTTGAHIAALAKFLSKNPQLHGMVPAHSDDWVADLQRDWRALPVHIASKCAYEIQKTDGIRIVDEQSASALCDGPVDPIDKDHIQIVKPGDRSDISYIAFRQAYLTQSVPTAPAPNVVSGLLTTARSIEVDCGQTSEDTALVPPPISLKPEQKVIDAVAALQEGENLKEQEVDAKGIEQMSAKVYYRLVGPDRKPDGSCQSKGSGVIVVGFVVTQPADVPFSAEIQPISARELAVAAITRPGAIKIVNAQTLPSIYQRANVPGVVLKKSPNLDLQHVLIYEPKIPNPGSG